MKTVVVAKAVVLNQDNKLLALRRSRTDTRRPLQWDLPGGWVDEGENIEQAVVREIREEAGIATQINAHNLVFVEQAVKEDHQVIWLFFGCKADIGGVKLSSEHEEYTWFSLDEAIDKYEYPLHQRVFQHIKEANLLDTFGV
jgi:8-oxo-dGTP diphosphatase